MREEVRLMLTAVALYVVLWLAVTAMLEVAKVAFLATTKLDTLAQAKWKSGLRQVRTLLGVFCFVGASSAFVLAVYDINHAWSLGCAVVATLFVIWLRHTPATAN